MKCLTILLLAVSAALGQTATASIAGTVLDAKTQRPISTAWVMAKRAGLTPLVRNTKSGGAGEFQIQGLPAGEYSLCVADAAGQPLARSAPVRIPVMVSKGNQAPPVRLVVTGAAK